MSFRQEMVDFNNRLAANANDARKRKINAKPEVCDSTPKRAKLVINNNVDSNNSLLFKIVNHLKIRRQQKQFAPLTLDEILQETSQCDVSTANKNWLINEALPQNEKIEVVGDRYSFKPSFKLKNPTELLDLVRNQFSNEMGMITKDSLGESIGDANIGKALDKFKNEIAVIKGNDKKDLIYGQIKGMNNTVNDDFLKLWRSCSVSETSESKICESLRKEGIHAYDFKDMTGIATGEQKKGKQNKRRNCRVENGHMTDVLIDYNQK